MPPSNSGPVNSDPDPYSTAFCGYKNPNSEYGYESSYQKNTFKNSTGDKRVLLNFKLYLSIGIKLGYFFPTNHFFKTIQQLYKNYSKLQAEYRKRLNPGTNSDLGWIRGSVYDE